MSEINKKSRNGLIIALIAGIVICLGVAVWALFFRGPKVVLAPDYSPETEEPNAEAIEGDVTEKLESEVGGGAIRIDYLDQVTVDLSDRVAYLQFANPGRYTQDMVLQIAVNGEVIVQSGTIKPGNQVRQLELLPNAHKMLSQGVYSDSKFVVLCYDQVSGEKAMLNTEAKITLTVQE